MGYKNIFLFSFLLISLSSMVSGQNSFYSSHITSPILSDIEQVQYVSNGNIGVVNNGELFQVRVDSFYNIKVDYITNTPTSLNRLFAVDVISDGEKELLAWDSNAKGIYRYNSSSDGFDEVEQLFSGTTFSLDVQDFDNDGKEWKYGISSN